MRDAYFKDKICAECEEPFTGYVTSRYCPDCAKNRQSNRVAQLRAEGPLRPMGSTDQCAACGSPYEVRSGTQKYCSNCRDKIYKEHDNEGGKRWYKENATREYKDKRNAARRKKRKDAAVICEKDLTEKQIAEGGERD